MFDVLKRTNVRVAKVSAIKFFGFIGGMND